MNFHAVYAFAVTAIVAAAVGLLSVLLTRSPYRYWTYLFLASVPFDLGAPLGYIPRISVVDYVSLAALIAFLLKTSLREKIGLAKESMGWPLIVFWVLFLVCSASSALILNGSLKEMFRWGEFLFVYFVATLAVQEDQGDLCDNVGYILTGLGAGMAFWAMIQYVGSGMNYMKTYAIFDQHNGFAAFISLCLPASWAVVLHSKRPRLAWRLCAGLISAAFLAAYSRGSWMGLLSALAIMLLWRSRKPQPAMRLRFAAFVFLMVCVLAPVSWIRYREHVGKPVIVDRLSLSDDRSTTPRSRFFSTSQRPYYWKASSDILRAHPLFGLGPKNYDRQIASYLKGPSRTLYDEDVQFHHRTEFWMHLHNMYLQVLVENGWIGYVLWSLALSLLIAPLLGPGLRQAGPLLAAFQMSALAFLIHNTVDILFVNSFDLAFVILVALCLSPGRGRSRRSAAIVSRQ